MPYAKRTIIGLDLGQVSDPSALALLEEGEQMEPPHFAATYLHRWNIGTPYPKIIEGVSNILETDGMKERKVKLAVDATGVGRPVVDMFRAAKLRVDLFPVVITGGHKVNYDSGVWNVPKRILVGTIQVSLQTKRFKFAARLPEAATLACELQNFQLTITENANDTYEGRKGSHDDLVLAVALGLWVGDFFKEQTPIILPETIEYSHVRW